MSRRVSNRSVAWFAAACLASGVALAEDFPFEKTSPSEFEKGFADTRGMTKSDKESADTDRLKFGGTLWNQLSYYHFGGASSSNSFLLNPNTLWLYADGRLKNDVRGFVKLRTVYDPTATGATNVFTGTTTQKTTLDLQELKLMFSANKAVFFTVGKQKIKWGSGKFWNPTDFLNSDQRNFLYSTDLRSGLTQIKTHVPIGASNFYLINGLDNSNTIYKVRNAVRAEVPIGPAEISASASTRTGTEPIFGLDVSSALWKFDVYGEVAYSAGNNQTFYSSSGATTNPTRQQVDWMAGIQWEVPYADNDTMTFSFEYFRNGLGYTTPSDYASVIAAGAYQPFRLSQQYGMLMFYLPKPGHWNNVTFSLYNIVNLTDFSATTRVSTLFQLLDELQLELAFGAHYGNGNGEFMYGGQLFDTWAQLMINF